MRPVELVRIDPAPQQIVRALPDVEPSVLTRATGRGPFQIVRWYTRSSCSLPADTTHVYDPLAPPLDGATRTLRLPLARTRADGVAELWLSDGRCELEGPLAPLDPARVEVLTSSVDKRSLLFFLDPSARLEVLDVARSSAPHAVAERVSAFELRAASGDPVRDVLWIREGGALVARELDGTARVRLGSDVRAHALYDSLAPRVAYVDGSDLYEAMPPSYVPALRAEQACAPRYDAEALYLHVPCDARQLVRVPLSTGAAESFPRGVFDSLTLGALRVDWQADGDATRTFVTSPRFGPQELGRALVREGLVALDETRIVGRSADGELVVWSLDEARADTLLDDVDELLTHTSALGDTTWVVHHEPDARGLGSLATVALPSLAVQSLARGVPRATAQGYGLVRSDLLGRLPAGTPLLVYRDDATPLGDDADRYAGALRAALLGAGGTTLLSEQATSFTAITEPFPGFLVSIEEGPRSGLWLAAL